VSGAGVSGAEPAAAVLERLAGAGTTLAVAESLTGGLLAAEFVQVPGASRVFRGSVTAYATELKGSVLGVDRALLAAEGAVHPEVARQMAAGVRRLMGADYGLATTGVAGPEPQDGRPVGTVYTAVAGPEGTMVSSPRLSGDRATIRRMAVADALSLLDGFVRCGRVCDPADRG
jgi:nicotinamide-nucleotide amidase